MSLVDISSRGNPRFKGWMKILDRGPQKTGSTLVSGRRICQEVASLSGVECKAWLVPEGWDSELPAAQVPRFVLSAALFRELDVMGVEFPLLEVDVARRIRPAPESLEPGLYLALPTQDPLNTGAAVRTAVGLGLAGIFLLPGCASPFHPRAVRASSGAVFRTHFHSLSWDRIEQLPASVFLLDSRGQPLAAVSWPATSVLVIGAEGPGVAPFNSEVSAGVTTVSLPMKDIESYNATVAAAMAMYDWWRKR